MKYSNVNSLCWRQTKIAWVAALRDHADRRGQSLDEAVPLLIAAFCSRLLSYAGVRVCVPFDEHQSEEFLQYGRLIVPSMIELSRGEDNECHANSARLWKAQPDILQLVTGYALTAKDQMWRQHTWLHHIDGHIVETTEPRTHYFGITMSQDVAEYFALCNRLERE